MKVINAEMQEAISSNFPSRGLTKTRASRATISRALAGTIFYSTLIVIALTAVPYGAAQPWWRALADCLILVLATLALVEKLFETRVKSQYAYQLVLPVLALVAFAFIQTISWGGTSSVGGVTFARTLSADVFQTRLFMLHLTALILTGWLLVRYTTSTDRLRHLMDAVILIGVLSAGFGLWRQATQHQTGFLLPYLRPGYGYGQFINSNHFAFLMEMSLGLALGVVVCRGADAGRLFVYLFAAIPMWVAVVLANSRGGLISILCQAVLIAALLVSDRTNQARTAGFSRIQRAMIRIVLVVTLLAGVVATIVAVGGDPLAGRIDSMSAEFDRKTAESYTLRQNVWQATWDLIKQHPIAGAGFGGYWIAIAKYHHASGETTPQQAHNDYLELLASGGLIGLALCAWFVVVFVRAARVQLRSKDNYRRAVAFGALAGIVAVMIHSLVDFGLHIPVNAFVFAALVSLATIQLQKSEEGTSYASKKTA